MAATGEFSVAETVTVVGDGALLAGAGLSASNSMRGLLRLTKIVRPPSTMRFMPPSSAVTSTLPSITCTALRSPSTTTVKVVPLTTAASIGVSTVKWGIPVCFTLNSNVPSV